MVSKSHAPKKETSSRKSSRPKTTAVNTASAKTPTEKGAGTKTKAPAKEKASEVAAKTSNVKKTTKAPSKTPTTTGHELKPYHFLHPLPNGFDTKLLEEKADEASGERKLKLRVMASLYAGHDYSQAADENHVPLGNVYLWLSDFRRGGLAAL